MKMNHCGLIEILLVCFLAPCASAQYRVRPLDQEQGRLNQSLRVAFREVVRSAAKSTVIIRCGGKDVSLGTIVDADGWIVTKASELGEHPTVHLKDGRFFTARLAKVDENYDLAMLKIDARQLPAAKLKEAEPITVGQWVATVGTSPLPIAVGVISVGNRKIPTRAGMLGVQLEDAEDGVKVVTVLPESGAAHAGILKDDIIVSIAGKTIGTRDDVTGVIQKHRLGDQLRLLVKRGAREMEVIATLGRRSASTQPTRAELMNAMGGPLSHRSVGFPTVFQHDTVLQPNECGGPVVNLDGQIVGINIARAGRTESYALPAHVVAGLLDELEGQAAKKK